MKNKKGFVEGRVIKLILVVVAVLVMIGILYYSVYQGAINLPVS